MRAPSEVAPARPAARAAREAGAGRGSPGRIFVVGAPRSGTTLMQALLAAHRGVVSFPESHFFAALEPQRAWARRLGLASRRARPRLERFVREAGLEDDAPSLPRLLPVARLYGRRFVRMLDRAALRAGAQAWVEKTPIHLHHVGAIRRAAPDARFVHVVRHGSDVVASLYDVTKRHAEAWGGERSIDACLERWMGDVRLSLRHRGDPAHVIVSYERLTVEPRATLERVAVFAALAPDDDALGRHAEAARALVTPDEPWKRTDAGPVEPPARRKFLEVLDEGQRRRVSERVARFLSAEAAGLDLGQGG